MLKRLIGTSEQDYKALAEAARLHDHDKLSQAEAKGLDLNYVIPAIGKSALQIFAENHMPGDDAFVATLKDKTQAQYKIFRLRKVNEDVLSMVLKHNFTVPVDSDGYVLSYDADDVNGIKQFFNLFGFVVVRNVLTEQECQKTIDEIWEVQGEMSGGVVKRDDESTWNERWPGMRDQGISGGYVVTKPQFVRNRSNPKVHQVASVLLSENKLLTNIDRFGIFRPTDKHPEWKTTRNLHLDMNPVYWYESKDASEDFKLLNSLNYEHPLEFIEENNVVGSRATDLGKKVHIQGLINLSDNREQDGGFLICPRVHARLAEVTESKLALWRRQFGAKNKFCVLPVEGNEEIHKDAVRVTARAGSLVFWSQSSPHGSAPNNSSNFRYAQYIKMFPASTVTPQRAELRRTAVKKMLKKAGIKKDELSDLGKKVHGLSKW